MTTTPERKAREQDEQILAAIIAGAETTQRDVRPSNSHDGVRGGLNGFGIDRHADPCGPCCAVAAGCLYRGILCSDDPVLAFAEKYGVSTIYAQAVSDGFETPLDHDRVPSPSDFFEYDCGDTARMAEYQRGLDVGRAAFQAICLPSKVAP